MPVATQHQVLALLDARRAPSRSPWFSSVLTLLENTIATMPTRPSGQHRQVARTVAMIDHARWLGMLVLVLTAFIHFSDRTTGGYFDLQEFAAVSDEMIIVAIQHRGHVMKPMKTKHSRKLTKAIAQ